jgi:hypothetical protein
MRDNSPCGPLLAGVWVAVPFLAVIAIALLLSFYMFLYAFFIKRLIVISDFPLLCEASFIFINSSIYFPSFFIMSGIASPLSLSVFISRSLFSTLSLL